MAISKCTTQANPKPAFIVDTRDGSKQQTTEDRAEARCKELNDFWQTDAYQVAT